MPTTDSGFLTRTPTSVHVESANARPRQALNPALIKVEQVAWRAGESADITTAEREMLASHLHGALQAAVRGLPESASDRAVVVRAAITRIDTVSPALNTASAVLLFVPLDRGGAAVEIEAIDPQTGEQLAASVTGYYPPMKQLKSRFRKLAPAEIALDKAATEFEPLLRAARLP